MKRKSHRQYTAVYLDRYCFRTVMIVMILLSGCLVCSHKSIASDSITIPALPEWSFLIGYGSSHPGWGETETSVETIDLILRRESIIARDVGSSWYRGNHSLILEIPFHYLLDYNNDPMIGLNFLASYTFTSNQLQPYIFVGGGPVYVDAEIPGMGSDWNGNYQLGIGCKPCIFRDNNLFVEVRYHHISNGNFDEPNTPLNSLKFLVGLSF